MPRNRFHLALLALAMALGGCLKFGEEISTTNPRGKHIERCRAAMYLSPDLDLEPLAFRLIEGPDDSIWFKFIAHTNDPAEVFDSDVVDASQWETGYIMNAGSLPAWWDVGGQKIIGGQVQLPSARFMKVGVQPNDDDTLTVYVSWHETLSGLRLTVRAFSSFYSKKPAAAHASVSAARSTLGRKTIVVQTRTPAWTRERSPCAGGTPAPQQSCDQDDGVC